MQEWLGQLLSQYGHIAPLIIFVALIIAGLNVPISEELTVIAAGIFSASTGESASLLPALLAGAIGGDMISYVLGRKIGRPLLELRWFRHLLPRLELLGRHFSRHAALTILLGRLIPFGVRNGLSLCAGMTRLPAWRFLLFDTISAQFSISVIYLLSRHYGLELLQDIRLMQSILLVSLIAVVAYIVYHLKHSGK